MKKTIKLIFTVSALLFVLSGCSKQGGGSTGSATGLGGYADPDGVFILNQGPYTETNSSMTYIAPDGTIEENVYRKVNGTSFGNGTQDMCMYNGKLYIISNGTYTPGGEEGDGVLVIADAVTLKKEKSYKLEDMKFRRPEGSTEPEEWMHMVTPFESISVIDERNIFIKDGKALYRFDSTTDELVIIEGGFHFGNQGGTIDGCVSTRGILRIGDCLYCGGGGFWVSTRLMEFRKGMNKVSRELPDLKGDFISGICRTGEKEVMLATCGRGGTKNSYLYFVDIDKWEIVEEKKIAEDISAEFHNNSGIALLGDYIYYAAGSTTVRRLSLKTWKSEVFVDVTEDAPAAKYLNCNVVADPQKQYIYVAVSDELWENVSPENNNVLVYDCSGEKAVLVKNIVNQTVYPAGIYPMSKFY